MLLVLASTLLLAALYGIHLHGAPAEPQARHNQGSGAEPAATGSPSRGEQAVSTGRKSAPENCPAARRALRYYRNAYTAHRQAMRQPGAPTFVPYGCAATRRRAVEWRARAHAARVQLADWTRQQYAWWTWMPRGSKEYRVASCETGYGHDPNFAHDSGTYVSAWGIYRPAYADDAHRVGNLSWDETLRARGTVPTPREQWQAMRSHRAAHGGWAGWGCRSA